MAFEIPAITTVALQSAVLAVTSNVLAQVITAYRNETTLVIDWVPVVQFTLFQFFLTHPNVMWQEFLESTWPAHEAPPAPEKAASKPAEEPKLNIRNTIIKTVLDQTISAAVNTILFSLFLYSVQMAMARPEGSPLSSPEQSVRYLFSRGAVDYSKVNWDIVWAKSKADFWPLIFAGWKLWPLVSVVNFAFIKTVTARNLVGGLAGMVWNIYLCLLGSS